jgi:hypothetical protein
MLNQSTSIGPSSAFAPSGVIAAPAAKTRSGYSLDQKLYCDDEVFAADMQQVVSRKWIGAGAGCLRRRTEFRACQSGREFFARAQRMGAASAGLPPNR